MNTSDDDTPKPKPPSLTTSRTLKLNALEQEARQTFEKALQAYIKAAGDAAWFRGWDSGFSDGWDAHREWMVEAAKKASPTDDRRPPIPPPPETNQPKGFGVVAPGTPAADLVLAYIEANPGKRGVEIANFFEGNSPGLPERTVRTALHRLKVTSRHPDGKIKNVNGGWYTLAAAPSDSQPSLMEDD